MEHLRRPSHVIVDRDGVLNEEAPAPGYILEPKAWRWLSGSLDALALLTRAGIRVSVATNQSGVGRGLMSMDALHAVHARMLHEVRAAGGEIAGVFACTHGPQDGCDCRKPAPGLLQCAIRAANIDPDATVFVGDARRDLEAATGAGIRAALVLTGKGKELARQGLEPELAVYENLESFARTVVERPKHKGCDCA